MRKGVEWNSQVGKVTEDKTRQIGVRLGIYLGSVGSYGGQR